MTGRLDAAIAAIDALNAGDPTEVVVRGRHRPKELGHAELVTEWVVHLDPEATEPQLLAARAHHLRRWTVPRSDHPEGRAGYLRWRAAAKRQHAEEVAGVLERAGYDAAAIERTQQLIRKEGFGHDPAVQVHEDALCLVFLELQLDEVLGELGEVKALDILIRTVAKMSAAGVRAAQELPLSEAGLDLVRRALAAGPTSVDDGDGRPA